MQSESPRVICPPTAALCAGATQTNNPTKNASVEMTTGLLRTLQRVGLRGAGLSLINFPRMAAMILCFETQHGAGGGQNGRSFTTGRRVDGNKGTDSKTTVS